MLNGKFYTGLPPGMLERSNTSTQRNHMQSSIFWPDDTKVDSVLETRVKRRNSLQIAQNERPQLRMQSSVIGTDDTDVNTRQLFQKEFSKSSIEFLDNLCDETKARKPLLLRGNRSASKEVTAKPTAMNLPLPVNVVNEGYTTAKKKQAFTSKIEFYDYTGDELNKRNNLRRAKMDMNDKKEMERNTKNSPKLQVKNNMRNLNANEKLYSAELRGNADKKRVENIKFRNDDVEVTGKNNMREAVDDREHDRYVGGGIDEDFESGDKNRFKDDLDYLESRRTVSPEYGYRREQRLREVYEDDYQIPDYVPNRRYRTPVRRANSVGRFTSPPKRILKHNVRERMYHDDYPNDGYRSAETSRVNERYRERDNELYDQKAYNDPNADVDYMDGRMRNIRIGTSPRKHVTYSDDTYSHNDDDDEMPNRTRRTLPNSAQSRNRTPLPNMRTTGSNQQRQQQQQRPNLRRYDSEMDLMEDVNNEMLEQTFMENDTHDSDTTIKSLNVGSSSSYNNNKNKNNKSQRDGDDGDRERERSNNVINKKINSNNKITNTSRLNNQTIASAARKITPKLTTTKQNTDPPTEASAEAMGGNDVKKHLRSSLCLHNGEIVASDDGGETSTKAAPTRNARSMATRQRISVGLPD